MMSFSYSLRQTDLSMTFAERIFFNIIKEGPIPKHCAIILDGNRRYARRFLSGCLSTGYKVGYTVFLQTAHMLYAYGVNEMTVYMLSPENYKRAASEVESILDVLLSGVIELEKEIDFVNELGICFQVIGNWETVPYPGLTEAYARLMIKTKGNNKFRINLATGYSGRQEMVAIAEVITQALEAGHVFPSDVNEKLVQNILSLKGTSPVDLLIRTSGDTRLSDFLLWTTNDNACLEFIDITWPEFKLSHLTKAIFSYQKQILLSSSKPKVSLNITNNGQRIVDFLELLSKQKWEDVEALCTV